MHTTIDYDLKITVGPPGLVTSRFFDPDKVDASKLRRVYDLPANQDRLVAYAEAIEAVIVNGTVIRRENKDQVDADGSLPGKLLRHGHARA